MDFPEELQGIGPIFDLPLNGSLLGPDGDDLTTPEEVADPAAAFAQATLRNAILPSAK